MCDLLHHLNTRAPDGRYVVRLPFNNSLANDIGERYTIASEFVYKLQQKLRNNRALFKQYDQFICKSLGHIQQINPNDVSTVTSVNIPHHAVVRESSAAMRIRIVFNTSCVTSNGTTINARFTFPHNTIFMLLSLRICSA